MTDEQIALEHGVLSDNPTLNEIFHWKPNILAALAGAREDQKQQCKEYFKFWAEMEIKNARQDEREKLIQWLNGAVVDDTGRLVLTREYIVSCIRALKEGRE